LELDGKKYRSNSFVHQPRQPHGRLNVLTKNTAIWALVTALLGQKMPLPQPPIIPSGAGTPTTASNIRRDFRKLLVISGLPKIRFHDLRHTAASLMLNDGIPVLIVSKRLGHSKPSITLDVYGHLISSKQEEAAQLMDELMSEG